ncbi:hypothetical protein BH23CHL1_BH23CHL1_25510 [soil metagenome]
MGHRASVAVPRQTVLYAADEYFWQHTYVSLHSLLANNRDIAFDVRILSEAPNERFFANCILLQDMHGDVEISWLPVDDVLLTDAPTSITYITRATYYRLLIGHLLPATVRRVLYLDGDTIIRGSLRDLFTLDIDDWVLAATPEYAPFSHPARLGLPHGTPYFNAGVLHINLDLWRILEIEDRCLEYIQTNASDSSQLEYLDQDALNAVLSGKWRPIGPTFNFTSWTSDPQRLNDFDARTQMGGQIPAGGPAIAHYTGKHKPWQGGSPHPYESDYWHYRRQTPYADHLKMMRSKLFNIGWKVRLAVGGVGRTLPLGKPLVRVARAIVQGTRTSVFRATKERSWK